MKTKSSNILHRFVFLLYVYQVNPAMLVKFINKPEPSIDLRESFITNSYLKRVPVMDFNVRGTKTGYII